MKKIIFLIFILSLSIKAQDVKDSKSLNCVTRAASSQRMVNITPEELHVTTGAINPNLDFCIAVRAHRITRTNGTGSPVTEAFIEDIMNDLGLFFGDINFVWDQVINNANSDVLFDSDVFIAGDCPQYNFNNTDSFDDTHAIDIFFHPDDLGPGNSSFNVADGIANGTRIILSRNTNINILSHEVGHVLGLFHTFHGTFGGGTDSNCENDDGFGDPSHNVECVGQGNASNSGDYVTDTLADAGPVNDILADIDDCVINAADTPDYCGSGNLFSDPDPTNIMRGTYNPSSIDCFSHFTDGQKNRMKFFISSQSHLSSLLTNCPSPCDDCQGAKETMESIADTTDCSTVKLERPLIGNNCGDVVRIFWDSTSTDFEEIQPGEELNHDYIEDGSYLIKMIVLRDGSICEGIEHEIPITINCNSNPTCIDCNETGNLIMDSITPIDVIGTNPCGNYKLEIPEEVFECYNVLFNCGEDQNDLNPITSQDLYDDVFFFNYSTNGTYTPRIILIDLATGTSCYDEMAQDLTVSCHTEPCTNCTEDGNEIFNSIAMTPKGCGRYQVEVPLETLECYMVQIYNGINNSWTTINPDDLTNGFYVFEYDQNGTYTVAIRLINIASGIKDVCYINKRKVVIDCCPLSCKEVAQGIEVTNGGCGPNYFVPFGTNDCFSVFVNGGSEPFPIITEIFDGTNYGSNANYITIIDNLTGEVCETITDIPNFPGCFTGPFDNTKYKKFISVYPNPFSTEIYFKDSLDRSITKVEIYNTYGMRIKSQSYSERTPIAIDKGAPGLYFAKVYFEDGTIETIELIKK